MLYLFLSSAVTAGVVSDTQNSNFDMRFTMLMFNIGKKIAKDREELCKMYDFDRGLNRLQKLVNDYRKENRNEATTRLQLIDTLLFECLGWQKTDCIAEERFENKYTDYVFKAPRNLLILEAKREGKSFEVPINSRLEYTVKSLCNKNDNTNDAIDQVIEYCQQRGVPYAAIANGHQIGIFKAVRTDGTPPKEGSLIFFDSLDCMVEYFTKLWNLLSKEGLSKHKIDDTLRGTTVFELPHKLSARLENYPGLKGRNVFQTDLSVVSDLVLEDLTRIKSIEKEFLLNCYCKSGALSQYSLASKSILNARYESLFGYNDNPLNIRAAVNKDGVDDELINNNLINRPILLIGDVGVGKTTFIKNLITIEAPEFFAQNITVYLDLGSKATMAEDIKKFVVQDLTNQLLSEYKLDIFESNFVRGVYHFDLDRFRNGIYGALKTTNPYLFMEKELEYLSSFITDKELHLKKSLEHIVKARKKQIIIFIDNADQRSDDTQQEAFLIAQELAENWKMSVFMTLRPETFIRSKKIGALTGYHPKAFTIAPPRVNEVLDKRLKFALKLTSGEVALSELDGVRLNLENLDRLIRIFLYSSIRNDSLYRCIDNVSSGNIRSALDMVKNFFGSGHVDTEKMIRIDQSDGRYLIPIHEFLRALMFNDNSYFYSDNSIISNIYDINSMSIVFENVPKNSNH